jgi:hypothetical protein
MIINLARAASLQAAATAETRARGAATNAVCLGIAAARYGWRAANLSPHGRQYAR